MPFHLTTLLRPSEFEFVAGVNSGRKPDTLPCFQKSVVCTSIDCITYVKD